MTDQATEDHAPPLTFYFDTATFSDREIAEILAMFSDLYRSVGGDELVIVGTGVMAPARGPGPA